MSESLSIYNAVRTPPNDALKPIQAGRLKGKTDINPMWRIKALTEQFGPCGIGWKYIIKEKRLEPSPNGEIAAFVDIDLFYKFDGQWSEAVPGTGGSSFAANERNGVYTSDECFKMALTDAISVACKALGFAADVYWQEDRSKYGPVEQPKGKKPNQPDQPEPKGQPQKQPDRPKEEQTQDWTSFFKGEVTANMAKLLYEIGEKAGYTKGRINTMALKRFKRQLYEISGDEYATLFNGFEAVVRAGA